jgi:hypothetical protein
MNWNAKWKWKAAHLHGAKFLAGDLWWLLWVWQSPAPAILASTRAHLGSCQLAPFTIDATPSSRIQSRRNNETPPPLPLPSTHRQSLKAVPTRDSTAHPHPHPTRGKPRTPNPRPPSQTLTPSQHNLTQTHTPPKGGKNMSPPLVYLSVWRRRDKIDQTGRRPLGIEGRGGRPASQRPLCVRRLELSTGPVGKSAPRRRRRRRDWENSWEFVGFGKLCGRDWERWFFQRIF